MSNVINLKDARKRRARRAAERRAAENRTRFGRTKAERRRDEDEAARREAEMDRKLLEDWRTDSDPALLEDRRPRGEAPEDD